MATDFNPRMIKSIMIGKIEYHANGGGVFPAGN